MKSVLIGGISLASLHLVWITIIATGFAQNLIDWIFKLHMLNSPFQIQPFNFGYAATLLLLTFLIGCFYGGVFELIRNFFKRAE